MAFGNFWRGGGRDRFGGDPERERDRDRWRPSGGDWRDENRGSRDDERYGAWQRDRDEYGGRESRFGERESGDDYGDRARGYGSQGYGSQDYGSRQYGGQGYGGERYRGQGSSGSDYGRRWGSEQRDDYQGTRSGSSEYDYRGGSGVGYGQSGYGYGTEGHSQGPGMFRGRGPRGYRRSDERIREDVCDCLTDDAQLDASNLEVQVKDCEVTLSGSVNRREDKRRAEDLVERISGVKDVRNNLRVSSEPQGQGGTQGQQGQQPGQAGQPPRH